MFGGVFGVTEFIFDIFGILGHHLGCATIQGDTKIRYNLLIFQPNIKIPKMSKMSSAPPKTPGY